MIFSFIIQMVLTIPSGILVPGWFNPETDRNRVSCVEDEQLIVYVENLEAKGGRFIFDVELINKSNHTVKIEPADWYYMRTMEPFPTNPEKAASFEDKLPKSSAWSEKEAAGHYKQKVEKQRNTGVLLNVLSLGLVVADAALDVRDRNSREWSPRRERAAVARDVITLTGLAAADIAIHETGKEMYQEQEDLYFLGKEIMKGGSLVQGESIRGKVFFPMHRAKYYRLILLIEGTEYSFDWRWAEYEEYRTLSVDK